ncbi:MAG TPA: TlpA disulfide reductase family protein [Candidatus Desulfobacillus denitrificans]|nr:TlpA disulfide reductase family protein [Candidatus Desulfobacillus denitrificans]
MPRLPRKLRLCLGLAALAAGSACAAPSALKPASAREAAAAPGPALAADLRKHRGQAVVVNFWATWCEPCRQEMPSLQRLARRMEGKGLAVLTVAVNDRETLVKDFLWEASVDLPVLHDREQGESRALGVRVLPTTLVFDRSHRLRLRAVGAVEWDAPEIESQLEKLLERPQAARPRVPRH